MVSKTRHGPVLTATLAALVSSTGCASYHYAARGPGPTFGQLPIDRMTPISSHQWSFFWGAVTKTWSPPLTCTQHEGGKCTAVQDPCEGKGAGLVDVDVLPYSYALALLTLGIAVPVRLTVYCSTYDPMRTGP